MTPEHTGVAPADDPMTYPGPPPPGDALLSGTQVLPIYPAPGLGLGYWHVGSPVSAATVDSVLRRAGGAPIGHRIPLLAVGSNRCPAQLAHKLHEYGTRDPRLAMMPVTQVRVRGIGTGHSAHIGRWGYVPYTALWRMGRIYYDQWMIWPDQDQLEIINGTEANYDLVDGPAVSVCMFQRMAEPVGKWRYYRSKHGALRIPDSASFEPAPATSQEDIYAQLLNMTWFWGLVRADTPEDAAAALAADGDLREAVRVAFRDHKCVVDDGLRPAAKGDPDYLELD